MTETHEARRLVHGTDGPIVIVSSRVCALLSRYAGLEEFRMQQRGVDLELDAALLAMHAAAASWRGSRVGTRDAPRPEPELSSWMSTSEAAGELRLTDRGVRKAIKEGRLDAAKHDKRWRISREDLEHFRARQQTTRGTRR